MSKMIGLFLLFPVFIAWGQADQGTSFYNNFMNVSHEIGRLVYQEDSLFSVMLNTSSELKKELDSKISHYDTKRSTIDSFLNAKNSIAITKNKVQKFDVTDAADVLNFSLKYNSLEGIRSNIMDCQNTLKEKRTWVLKHMDSLNGSYRITYKGTIYDVYITDLKDQDIELHQKKKGSLSLKSVKSKLESKKKKIKMITNAGMYTPKFDPEGLYISNGKEKFPLDTGSSERTLNFYMHPNGVFMVDTMNRPRVISTDEYRKLTKDKVNEISIATQSGPMLLIDGEIHPKFNRFSQSKKKRSGVGVFENKVVFAITKGYTNFFSFASFFQDYFDCPNALFLDGTISLMYLEDGKLKDVGGAFGPVISISE